MPLARDPAGPAPPARGGATLAPIFGAGRPQRRQALAGKKGFWETPRDIQTHPGPRASFRVPSWSVPPPFFSISPTRCFLFCTLRVPYRERDFSCHTPHLHLLSRPAVILAHRGWSDDWIPSDLSLGGRWAEGCGVGGEGCVALAVGNLPSLGSSSDPATSSCDDPGQVTGHFSASETGA